MLVADAQREVRTIYLGGFVGQLASAAVWLASAAATQIASPRLGILALVFGGMLIFPATQLTLRITGRPASLSPENPLRALAMQIAFLVPLLLPLIGAATLYKREWFYPAFMIVVGAHYLPFSFLYGMRIFLALGGILITGGLLLGLYAPEAATAGAWGTGLVLMVFAILGRRLAE